MKPKGTLGGGSGCVVAGAALPGYDAVGLAGSPFGLEAQRAVSIEHRAQGAGLVVHGRNENKSCIAQTIIGVGNHHRSIDRGVLAHNGRGAAEGRQGYCQAKQQDYRKKEPLHASLSFQIVETTGLFSTIPSRLHLIDQRALEYTNKQSLSVGIARALPSRVTKTRDCRGTASGCSACSVVSIAALPDRTKPPSMA